MKLSEIKKLIQEVRKKKSALLAKPLMLEMTFNRAKKHVEDSSIEFVMISAYRGGKGNPGNRIRHKEMKSAFQTAGFPFVDMVGGYAEDDDNEITEPSLLILGFERPDFKGERLEGLFSLASHLAKRYEQESFIYGAPARTSTKDPALREDPKTGELKPIMDIKAYDNNGDVINEPWAGPWNSLVTAKEDDVYWSVVGKQKGKLVETLKRYEKFLPLRKEHAMEKDFYLKSTKSGISFLDKKVR